MTSPFLALPANRIRSLKELDSLAGHYVWFFAACATWNNLGEPVIYGNYKIDKWLVGPTLQGGEGKWGDDPTVNGLVYLSDMDSVLTNSHLVRIRGLKPFNCLVRTQSVHSLNAIFSSEGDATRWAAQVALSTTSDGDESVHRETSGTMPNTSIERATIAPRLYRWFKEQDTLRVF